MSGILITGDTYLGSAKIENLAENGNKKELFGEFLTIINGCNLAITNLESPITNENSGKIRKTGPHLKASVASLSILKKAGFELVTLANNHILDYGKQGLESTLRACREIDLKHVGAGNSIEEAKTPFVTILEEQSICILNVAENEFSTTGLYSYGANPFDIIDNSYAIKKAKEDYDKVIVIVHGGREHYPLPSPKFKKTLRFFVENGADAIIAHHTHCVSGYEIYNNAPIFYGIGNFLFKNSHEKTRPLWNVGLGIKLIIGENVPISFELYPYHQGIGEDEMIRLLKGDEKIKFIHELEERNKIIEDQKLLELSWTAYIEAQKKTYSSLLFINNKWLRKFIARNFVPLNFFMNRTHTTHVLNLIQCEAHHEILVDTLLEEYFSDK